MRTHANQYAQKFRKSIDSTAFHVTFRQQSHSFQWFGLVWPDNLLFASYIKIEQMENGRLSYFHFDLTHVRCNIHCCFSKYSIGVESICSFSSKSKVNQVMQNTHKVWYARITLRSLKTVNLIYQQSYVNKFCFGPQVKGWARHW